MIVDTCTCGAEFHAGYSGLHAATDERFAHTEWLAAHAACRGAAADVNDLAAEITRLRTHITLWDAAQRVLSERDRLRSICAAAYQLAGTVGAPQRFLDALSRGDGDVDTLLPISDDEIESLRDAARLDWLADPNNQIGNVQIPTDCVLAHPESMRAAIDMAMRMEGFEP